MNFRPNGVIDDSPIPSPKDSPKKENDVERDKGSMLEVAGGGLKGELGTKRNVEGVCVCMVANVRVCKVTQIWQQSQHG